MMEYGNQYYNNAQGMMGTPFMGNPYVNQPAPTPNLVSTLSEEEYKLIQNSPAKEFNITIDPKDNIRSFCNHRDIHTGQDRVQQINDGTEDVYCPICGERWNPTRLDREEVEDTVQKINNIMQNCKWVGDLSIPLTRDYFSLLPLLNKLPELYEQAMNRYSKYTNQSAYTDANDANVYYQFNALMNRAPMMTPNYGQPIYNNYQNPAMNQQVQYPYGQQPMGNPMNNPMQAPQNTQFTDQANMMMGGQYYQGQPNVQQGQYAYAQQPMNQQAPNYAPNVNQGQQVSQMNQQQAQPNAQQGYAPNYTPAQQNAPQESKPDASGTVVKDTSVKL